MRVRARVYEFACARVCVSVCGRERVRVGYVRVRVRMNVRVRARARVRVRACVYLWACVCVFMRECVSMDTSAWLCECTRACRQ